ncbi:hypothetical protein NDI52_29920 [Leptolyngbya sp. PL-A3]
MTLISGWIRFNKPSSLCPVCGDHRNECRQSGQTEKIFCRGKADNPRFKFLGEDKNGFGIFTDRAIADSQTETDRAEWLRRRQAERTLHQEAERRRAAASMPVSNRHHHFSRLLEVLPPLTPADIKDLTSRDFSLTDIERIGFRSVVKGQRLPEQFPSNLPGVARDGRSLLIDADGYIYPIRNANGQIWAMQLRVRGETKSKYRWLSVEGNYRLPNGEIPLAHITPESITRSWQGFSEGTGPKPHLAAKRLGCPVIGAAGGQFAGSQSQVKAALESGRIPVLLPDGGAIANPHVMQQYEKLAAMVPRLQVLWWGQRSKGQDIDEVSDEVLASARLITWEEFREMSPAANRQQQLAEQFRRKQNLELIERCFKHSLGQRNTAPKGFSRQSSQTEAQATVDPAAGAIALYDRRNDGRLEMHVTPSTVPTIKEWIDRGRPTLVVQPDDRMLVCLELIKHEFPYVLICDVVGGGKSRTAGEFFENWEVMQSMLAAMDDNKTEETPIWKGVYASDDYRRPSHEWLEALPQAVSGAGEMLDTTKTTPLGNPYKRRAMPGETPDIPGLCIHEDAYQILNAQGFTMGRGNDSPFCENCTQFQGGNCPYLVALTEQQSEPVLRTHISKISVNEGENVIGFIDEAGRAIEGDVTRESPISAIEKEAGELLKTDPIFYSQVSSVLKAIKHGLQYAIEEQGRYGLTHAQLMEYLPDRQAIQALILEQFWTGNEAPDIWEIPTINQIAGRLQHAIRRDIEAQLQDAPEPEQRKELVKKCLTIGVLPRLLKVMDGRGRVDVSITGKKIRFRYRDRRHGRTLAKLKTAFLMDATPDRRELARKMGIDEGDIVSLTSPKPSFHNLTFKVVKGFGRAGQNREHYQNGVVTESPYSTMQRILALVEHVAHEAIATNPDIQIGLLDLKSYIDRYATRAIGQKARAFLTGYHFHDGRNTNRFKECSLLFSVGTPVQNIGDLLSQWHLRTGQSYTAETAPLKFWASVNRMVTTEILQGGGRSRAQHRSDEQITHYILSDLSQGQIETIQEYFPGCVVEVVDAYDICPQAAPKGEQKQRGVWEAIASAIKAGERPTQKAIASQVGVNSTRVSQIVGPLVKELNLGDFRHLTKSLVWLYKALNNQTKLSDLTPDQVTMAYVVFPELVKDLDAGTELEEALETFAEVAEILGYQSLKAVFRDSAMLSAVPATVLAKLIGYLSSYLPQPFLQSLESQGKELMEAIA